MLEIDVRDGTGLRRYVVPEGVLRSAWVDLEVICHYLVHGADERKGGGADHFAVGQKQ